MDRPRLVRSRCREVGRVTAVGKPTLHGSRKPASAFSSRKSRKGAAVTWRFSKRFTASAATRRPIDRPFPGDLARLPSWRSGPASRSAPGQMLCPFLPDFGRTFAARCCNSGMTARRCCAWETIGAMSATGSAIARTSSTVKFRRPVSASFTLCSNDCSLAFALRHLVHNRCFH